MVVILVAVVLTASVACAGDDVGDRRAIVCIERRDLPVQRTRVTAPDRTVLMDYCQSIVSDTAVVDTAPAVPVPPSTTGDHTHPRGYFEGTVTAVRNVSARDALTRLVPRPEIGPTDVATAQRWRDQHPGPRYGAIVTAVERGEWTFILEEGGYQGVVDEHISALSAGTRAVAIHHFSDGNWCQFALADDGHVMRRFTTDHYNSPYAVGTRLPEEDGLALGNVFESWDGLQTLFRRLVGRDAFEELAGRPQDALAAGLLPD